MALETKIGLLLLNHRSEKLAKAWNSQTKHNFYVYWSSAPHFCPVLYSVDGHSPFNLPQGLPKQSLQYLTCRWSNLRVRNLTLTTQIVFLHILTWLGAQWDVTHRCLAISFSSALRQQLTVLNLPTSRKHFSAVAPCLQHNFSFRQMQRNWRINTI